MEQKKNHNTFGAIAKSLEIFLYSTTRKYVLPGDADIRNRRTTVDPRRGNKTRDKTRNFRVTGVLKFSGRKYTRVANGIREHYVGVAEDATRGRRNL